MKKFIVLLTVVLFSIGIHAQETKPQALPVKEYVMMNEGKMWVVKDGNATAMTKDIVMSDGTMVSISGTVTLKDGTSVILQNGDAVDMDGKVTKPEVKTIDKPKMK